MTATLSPAPATRWIHRLIAGTEADLQTRFLGDDLDAACASAIQAADPVFMATAALPIKNRREAVTHWRKKQVRALLDSSPELNAFMATALPELQESIREGRVALVELDALVAAFTDEVNERRRAARSASKDALSQAIRAALRDCDGTESGPIVPGFLTILETGEVGLFRKRAACIEWARSQGCRFLMGNFEQGTHRISPGPETD